MLLNQ